ncbi:MAG: glycoside hydrolase family 20 zincin-like fold domain-containing protein [Bryobacteraceae bacterium]
MKSILCILLFSPALSAATVSPLLARGFTVMPAPQSVQLGSANFTFGRTWGLDLQGVAAGDVAVTAFDEELARRYDFRRAGSGGGTLRLRIAAGSVAVGAAQDKDKSALAEQAYRIELSKDLVTVTANSAAGLFYGTTTLAQLLKPKNGELVFPEGRIEDWPDLQLRFIYWDDAHHLDRMETFKEAIRRAAFFKINGIALKLEGHFQFKSAPAVVEPQAMSAAEYQELTNYGLRYHVQLIPFLDGPSHIAFILKHPEYAKLRQFPNSNYEACATNPEYYQLLEGMLQDLLDANRGGKYVYLSTDEAYYIGLADNEQCREAARAKELGSVGKLLAEFVTRTANYLHARGRTVMFWGEYPLKVTDIAALPSHVVNGEVYGPEFDREFRKHGIREMIYTSSQGEEKFFPNYFPRRAGERRVEDTFRRTSFDTARRDADLLGTINAAWGDMGLHPETFWLGYATAGAVAWHPGAPSPAESTAAFFPLFYGGRQSEMDSLYRLMSTQAQFWMESWETGPSKARTPIWGRSDQIYTEPRPAKDQFLALPPVPGPQLAYSGEWAKQNAKRSEQASEALAENDRLLGLLHRNLQTVEFSSYNLEVFLSIAHLYRQNLEMLRGLGQIDEAFRAASTATDASQAVRALDRALEFVALMRSSRNSALADATETWYKSWMPRLTEGNGRRYLHQVDDVKDHLPDRTSDMSYLVYRELLLPVGEWAEQLRAVRNAYAQAHGIPLRNGRFDWKDLKSLTASETAEISLE